MKKILIHGFPHCGTTIMKSILGHIDNVNEIVEESDLINQVDNNFEFTVCKSPYTKQEYFGDDYNDYIKIFVIRNPLFVFSSLNKKINVEKE